MRSAAVALAGAAAVLLLPAAARAHAIESSLELVPGRARTLLLQSQFSSGVPAAGAAVTLVGPGLAPIALGRTDAAGRLRLVVPRAAAESAAGSWELRVDQGPGHRDYLELPQAALPHQGPAAWLGWAGGSLSLLLIGVVMRALPRAIR